MDGFKLEDLYNAIDKALGKFGEESLLFNILISGKAGVGKSTLTNSMFRDEIAPTGIGSPVSIGPNGFTSYEKEGIPIKIYDTEGIELDRTKQDKLLCNLSELIKCKNSSKMEDRIHMIWYCINAESRRCEEAEVDFINRLSRSCEPAIPVILVLTQATRKKAAKAFKESLEEIFRENERIHAIIPVLAQTVEEEDFEIEAYGLIELCNCTAGLIPDAVKNSFINSQKVSLELKIEKANKIVNRYVGITSGIGGGAGIVGVDDSIALVGVQIAMFTEIGFLFGLKLDKNKLITLCSAAVGTAAAAAIGKTAFSQALRLIPIAGVFVAVIEGGVRAGIAGSVTKGVGVAYIAVMKRLAKGEIHPDDIEAVIVSILKKSKDKEGTTV